MENLLFIIKNIKMHQDNN